MGDEIVGHKTFRDGRGGFRHEPLTRSEADALWEQVEQSEAERAQKYPTERECVDAIFDACQRLEELGWKRADEARPDRELVDTISLGSTGIHKAYCESRPSQPILPEKWWWHPSEDGDLWPHTPIYFRPNATPPSSSASAKPGEAG